MMILILLPMDGADKYLIESCITLLVKGIDLNRNLIHSFDSHRMAVGKEHITVSK